MSFFVFGAVHEWVMASSSALFVYAVSPESYVGDDDDGDCYVCSFVREAHVMSDEWGWCWI